MRLVDQRSGKLILLIRQVSFNDRQVLRSSTSRVESQEMRRYSIDMSLGVSQCIMQEDDSSDGQYSEKGGNDESNDESGDLVFFRDNGRERRKRELSGLRTVLAVECVLTE
jgi:hypothetical protein